MTVMMKDITYVTESDGTTLDVDLCVVDTENLLGGNTNNGECLVEFPEINVVLLETCSLECLGDGKCWCGREVHWVTSGVCVSYTSQHEVPRNAIPRRELRPSTYR